MSWQSRFHLVCGLTLAAFVLSRCAIEPEGSNRNRAVTNGVESADYARVVTAFEGTWVEGSEENTWKLVTTNPCSAVELCPNVVATVLHCIAGVDVRAKHIRSSTRAFTETKGEFRIDSDRIDSEVVATETLKTMAVGGTVPNDGLHVLRLSNPLTSKHSPIQFDRGEWKADQPAVLVGYGLNEKGEPGLRRLGNVLFDSLTNYPNDLQKSYLFTEGAAKQHGQPMDSGGGFFADGLLAAIERGNGKRINDTSVVTDEAIPVGTAPVLAFLREKKSQWCADLPCGTGEAARTIYRRRPFLSPGNPHLYYCLAADSTVPGDDCFYTVAGVCAAAQLRDGQTYMGKSLPVRLESAEEQGTYADDPAGRLTCPCYTERANPMNLNGGECCCNEQADFSGPWHMDFDYYCQSRGWTVNPNACGTNLPAVAKGATTLQQRTNEACAAIPTPSPTPTPTPSDPPTPTPSDPPTPTPSDPPTPTPSDPPIPTPEPSPSNAP